MTPAQERRAHVGTCKAPTGGGFVSTGYCWSSELGTAGARCPGSLLPHCHGARVTVPLEFFPFSLSPLQIFQLWRTPCGGVAAVLLCLCQVGRFCTARAGKARGWQGREVSSSGGSLQKRQHGAVLQAPGELFVKRCCWLRCLPGGAGPRTRLRFPHSSCCLCKLRVCFCRAGGGKTRSESAAVPGWCQQLWRGARGWQQAAASGSVRGWSCCTPGTARLGCAPAPRPPGLPLSAVQPGLFSVPRWLLKAVKAHPRPQKSPPRLEFDTTAAFPHVLQELLV